MKIQIAVDVDNTLYDFYWCAAREAVRLGYTLLPKEEWGMVAEGAQATWDVINAAHSDSNILSSNPYPGVLWSMNKLNNVGDIHIVSSRAMEKADITRKWLEHHKIPFDHLEITQDKHTYFNENKCSVVIDDKAETIEQAVESGRNVATLVHPWNAKIAKRLKLRGNFVSAHNWIDLMAEMHRKKFFDCS